MIQDRAVHGQAIEDRSNCILHLRIPRLKLLDWRYCPHRKYVYYIYNQRKSQIPIYKNVYIYIYTYIYITVTFVMRFYNVPMFWGKVYRL